MTPGMAAIRNRIDEQMSTNREGFYRDAFLLCESRRFGDGMSDEDFDRLGKDLAEDYHMADPCVVWDILAEIDAEHFGATSV